MSALYLGVDPGNSGSMVLVGDDEGKLKIHDWIKLSSTPHDIVHWLDKYRGQIAFGLLETVNAMPGQGVSSTFKFGMSYGECRMALTALFIPHTEIRPSQWLGTLGLKKRKEETNVQWKNRHKEEAQRRFPGTKVTHANADAVLLAVVCKELHG